MKGLGAQKHASSEWWTLLSWGLRHFPRHPLQTSGLSGAPAPSSALGTPVRGAQHPKPAALTGKYRLFTTKGHSCSLWFASLPCCPDILMWVRAQLSTHLTVIQRKSQIKHLLNKRHENLGASAVVEESSSTFVSLNVYPSNTVAIWAMLILKGVWIMQTQEEVSDH